jgi:superfamily II DNA/RNA helicase
LFLSTDAGGVGLNLQHAAAVVVNMDMPWNPAVLEQRIGRVHRMGQSRGVQVINFVGQGSIEEGMLSVLAFKKSLFAGVLDGGEVDVFMQGTRLSKFMESVEQVAGAISEDEGDVQSDPLTDQPHAAEDSAAPAIESAAATARSAAPAEPRHTNSASPEPAPVEADPWAAILEAGAALLQGLAASRGSAGPGAAPIAIERDPVTGQASIRLPLPDPAVLQRLAKAFEPWLK